MRLNRSEKLVLELLSVAPDDGMRGRHLVERSKGKLWRSHIYFHLSALEKRGLVTHRETPPLWSDMDRGPNRYLITEKGRRALASYVPPKSLMAKLADMVSALFTWRMAS